MELIHFLRKLAQVGATAQLCILRPVPAAAAGGAAGAPGDEPVCIMNTHMFYHPLAPHIRTMHMAAIMAEAAALIDENSASEGPRPALIFAGDLNCAINDGIPGKQRFFLAGLSCANWESRESSLVSPIMPPQLH